jgi:hypothetical protein
MLANCCLGAQIWADSDEVESLLSALFGSVVMRKGYWAEIVDIWDNVVAPASALGVTMSPLPLGISIASRQPVGGVERQAESRIGSGEKTMSTIAGGGTNFTLTWEVGADGGSGATSNPVAKRGGSRSNPGGQLSDTNRESPPHISCDLKIKRIRDGMKSGWNDICRLL